MIHLPLSQRACHLLVATALSLGSVAAQQPATAPALPAGTRATAPQTAFPFGPVDQRAVKQLQTLLNQKFTRETSDIFYSLERGVSLDLSTLNASDRFLHFFRAGDWTRLRAEFEAMPADLARQIYDKMLADLTERQKPNVRMEDVLAIADAAPDVYNWDEVHRLGQLLGLVVPVNESYWLADRLKRGTEKLGGNDPERRLLTGRILLAGGFKDLAREWLPPLDQVSLIADEGVRNELTAFLSTQQESDAVRRGQIQRTWDENLRILVDPSTKTRDYERQRASSAMAKVITQIPASTLGQIFTDLVKNNQDAAVRILAGVGRKSQNERQGDLPGRTENIKAQAALANLLAAQVEPGVQPWTEFFDLMAEAWASEAENTFQVKTTPPNGQPKFIPPDELLAAGPAGKWFAALSPGVRNRIDVVTSKTILASANFDQAAERITDIAKRNAQAGVALAEDFLVVWGKTHSPELPESLRKKYDLADDARIPVTPVMMEKNIESLAQMMNLFRQAGIAPRDYEKVVSAFDLAYSSAEAYRPGHIEKVFGPLEKMDEPLFFLILSKMNANLGERWRKMEVQRGGVTRRDEAQTLEMVRAGYSTALQMIDGWLTGHPQGSRALTLAGTLLTDWGDFEYFQELVTSDARKRMAGYKEKNSQAQEYFQRGAEMYAAQVPKLGPGDYSIDAYQGWFNGLLGIGSGGQLNLSKAMNRAALQRIREHILALPGKAAQTHMNMFAKTLNARLADEKDPLHEDLKYRYLASSLLITKDDPFSMGAQKRVEYFDDLLREIRLQTRVDGPTTIGRDQDFGIVVSVIHTEAMGRVAKFGQYLTNDLSAGGNLKPKKKSALAKKMREAQGPRDEFELSLTETLSPFFDIRSITFASPDVKPRPTAQTGWEETILAYVLVHAKDASVDRIPPVEMELKFLDLTGPVTIPAESAETVIKIDTTAVASRPASNVAITQTLDTRQFLINGALPLEVKATASGLVPDLDQLIDLEALKSTVAIKNINAHDGLQVKELNTWGDQVGPMTERLWTISLDGDPIRAADGETEFRFPPVKAKDAAVVYQTYNDMNLATLPQPVTRVGNARADGKLAAKPADRTALISLITGMVALLVGWGVFAIFRRGAGHDDSAASAREVFLLPADVDGFAVIALLRRVQASAPALHLEPRSKELQDDIRRIERSCFGADAAALSEAELRGIAEKWIKSAQ